MLLWAVFLARTIISKLLNVVGLVARRTLPGKWLRKPTNSRLFKTKAACRERTLSVGKACWMDILEIEPAILRSGSTQNCVIAPRDDSGFNQAASKMDLEHPWSVQVVRALLDGRIAERCEQPSFCGSVSARQKQSCLKSLSQSFLIAPRMAVPHPRAVCWTCSREAAWSRGPWQQMARSLLAGARGQEQPTGWISGRSASLVHQNKVWQAVSYSLHLNPPVLDPAHFTGWLFFRER